MRSAFSVQRSFTAQYCNNNNLTRKVYLADPLQIVEVKGLIAGPFNLLLGLSIGAALPSLSATMIAGVVVFFGCGVSLALFIVTLRHLGTARTSAYFSTSLFIGSGVAIVALGEAVISQFVIAGRVNGRRRVATPD